MTPEIEPSWMMKAADWAWAGVVGLIGIVYKNVDGKVDKTTRHIEKLYENAENDRAESRENMVELERRMQDTMRLNSADIVRAIGEIKR